MMHQICCKSAQYVAKIIRSALPSGWFSNAQLQLLKVKGMMLMVVLIFFDFPFFLTRQTRWQK